MNAPDRYERFVVPEGTKKVSYERDTKIINAASFTIEREDHTIGNILRMQLHRDENVLFAGYKLPHPLQYKIIVRIHTTSQSSPMQAYNQAINDLDKEFDHLKSCFESGYIASSTGTSPSPEMTPPPQSAADPIQSSKVPVTVSPQAEGHDDSVSEINSENRLRGVKRSWVWDHFIAYEEKKKEKKKDATGKIKEVEVVHKRAKCVYCPKGPLGDYAVDSGKNGTSGMLNHIRKYCRYYPANVDKNQKIISGDKSQGNKLVVRGFVQTDVLEACAEMIIIDELSFSVVEKKGFRKFCSVACPLFNVPSRRTIVRQFLQMYDEHKLKLKKDLRETRVCLTTDTWTSVQNCNYMVLTAHFIDSEWKMHKRVLNFCVISNHQGPTIGKLIENCLLDWGIEKVMAITVDNASANKVAINLVRSKLNRRVNAEPVLEGKYLHVRCLAHITNLIVVSGLKRLSKSILAIRNAVRYVRSSPQRLIFFKTCVEKEGLSLKGMVCMDVPTRWNSTFVMLDAALKYKKAFVRMGEDDDSPFLAYFKEPEHEIDEDGVVVSNSKHIRVGPPSEDDWENATIFVKFLRVFYEVTLKVSASLHPTVNKAFHSILAIEKEIDKLFVSPEMATGSEAEKVLVDMASKMREKYNKYFVKFEDMNVLLVVAIVLDPRFKLRHVTHLFKKEKFDEAEVENKTKELKGVLMSIYEEYAPRLDGGIHMRSGNANSTPQTVNTNSEDVDDIMDDWIKVVEESEVAVVAHEVDTYLHDPLELTTKEVFFDILLWWKLNGPKYPVLAAIAKDILAIQVSTVASESCFSTGGRVIDAFRSSLTPRSVEALICMQNWLKGDEISTNLEDEPTPEEYEFYESVELEYASTESAATSTNTFGSYPKGKGIQREMDM